MGLPRRHAPQMPMSVPITVAANVATPDEQDRRPERGRDHLGDRPGEDVGDAELAPRGVAEVVEELDPERAVEPELPLDLFDRVMARCAATG